MSLKYTYTTADYLPWNEMTTLVRRLFDDEKYAISLLIACGSFMGLRISDLRALKWIDILDVDTLVIMEKKTGKRRLITINPQLQKHIKECYMKINPISTTSSVFVSRMGTVYSIQRLNVIFKELKLKYNLTIQNFSSHSLRKTFGRKIVDNAGVDAGMALIRLSELFNHTNIATTRRYLGLRQQEIQEIYTSLSF